MKLDRGPKTECEAHLHEMASHQRVAAVRIERTTQGFSVDVVSYPFNRALANPGFPLQIA